MNKTIIPIAISAAMLASCDHYDHTDGRAIGCGKKFQHRNPFLIFWSDRKIFIMDISCCTFN